MGKMEEELKGNQHKIDKNKNNKIDSHDFAILRGEKKAMKQEEVEQIQEYESKDGVYRHQAKQGRYGGSEKPVDSLAGVRGPAKSDLEKIEAAKKKKKFSEMVEIYKQEGIKGLFEELRVVEEEASQEEFNKEIEKQKRKASGTATEAEKADVAAPATKGTKEVKEEVEQIEERELTDAEAKKKEEIVKGMKKGISGFKERYGERAKEVMYATATARAKGE